MDAIFTIKRKHFDYEVWYNGSIIFTGKRKQRFLRGPVTYIYDAANDKLIATLKEQYFVFFSFGYTISFSDKVEPIRIMRKNGIRSAVFDNRIHYRKYGLFSTDPILYVDSLPVGKYELLEVDSCDEIFTIECKTKEQAVNFSIMEIAVDDTGF